MPINLKFEIPGLLSIEDVPDNLTILVDSNFILGPLKSSDDNEQLHWFSNNDDVLRIGGVHGIAMVNCKAPGDSEMQLQVIRPNEPPRIDRRYLVKVLAGNATELTLTDQGDEPLGAEQG